MRNQDGDSVNFVLSYLTGLGVGSGGLYILWLTQVKGALQTEAQGMNLLFFSLSILSASVVNIICKRVLLKPLLVILVFALATSYPAALMTKSVDNELLKRLFGGFLVLLGGIGFFQKNK